MSQKLSREEFLDLVKSIMTVRNINTGALLSEQEHHALVMKFKDNINHPGGTDLIYYPELVGLPSEPTAEEIVDLAMKGISPEQ